MPTDWSEDFIPGEYATGEAACDDEDEDEESGVEDDSESMLTELSSLQQDDCLPTLSTNGDEKLKRLAMQFIQAAEQEVVEKQKNTSNAEKPSVVLPKFVPRSIPKQRFNALKFWIQFGRERWNLLW